MAVGEVGRGDGGCASRVQVLADVDVEVVPCRLPADALVTRPTEVLDGGVGRVGNAVDLLPGIPTDVGDPEFARPGPEREPIWIAQSIGDVPIVARDPVADERVIGQGVARVGVDAGHRAAALGRVAARSEILGAERAALGRRQAQRLASRLGRVAAGIGDHDRVGCAAVLAPVGEACRRALAGADVERPVRSEREVVDGVRLLLVAPVRAADDDLLGPDRDVGVLVDRDPRQAAGGRTAVLRAAGRERALVVVERRDAAGLGVDGVQQVDVRSCREPRVDGQAGQTPVARHVDLGRQVDDRRRGGVSGTVVREDQAAPPGDEVATVRREGDRGRRVDAARDGRDLESGLDHGRSN